MWCLSCCCCCCRRNTVVVIGVGVVVAVDGGGCDSGNCNDAGGIGRRDWGVRGDHDGDGGGGGFNYEEKGMSRSIHS